MKIKKMTSLLMIQAVATISTINCADAAVSLNPKGIGQVLIYPYYTVNNNINTLISVVNTTDRVKATKIRFLEGKNNRDVLIFSIYLGPYDVWTAALNSTTSSLPNHEGEPSVKLITHDNTCTVPDGISGQEFLPYALEGDFDDGLGNNLSRATEGQIQIFEMGNVTGTYADWVYQSNGSNNCAGFSANWTPDGGAWIIDASDNMQAPDGSGGLYGTVSLIDVAGGFDVSYTADAIQGYSTELQHQQPANLLPDLNSGSSSESVYSNYTGSGTFSWNSPVKAISSLFTVENLFADFAISASIGADTESILTFPTKHYFVDPFVATEATPMAPFTSTLGQSGACETAQLELHDRETAVSNSEQQMDLCWGVNVLEFTADANSNGESTLMGSNNVTRVNTTYDTGWLNLLFEQSIVTTDESQTFGAVATFHGLPMTGFSIQRYVNANLSGGILANYAGLISHKSNNSVGIVIP